MIGRRYRSNECEGCGEHTRCLGEPVEDEDGNEFCSDECMVEHWKDEPDSPLPEHLKKKLPPHPCHTDPTFGVNP